MAKKTEIEIYQGESFSIPITCGSPTGDVTDWTGWKVRLVVKSDLSLDNTSALIDMEVNPDPLTGIASFDKTNADTKDYKVGEYTYQFTAVSPAGKVAKSELGVFTVNDTTLKGTIS